MRGRGAKGSVDVIVIVSGGGDGKCPSAGVSVEP